MNELKLMTEFILSAGNAEDFANFIAAETNISYDDAARCYTSFRKLDVLESVKLVNDEEAFILWLANLILL